jgi:hypothetical protein
MSKVDSCRGCGKSPGEGYSSDCQDMLGCGYWKQLFKDAGAIVKPVVRLYPWCRKGSECAKLGRCLSDPGCGD